MNRNFYKVIFIIILALAIAAGVFFLALHQGWIANNNNEELQIEETSNVVAEIRKISEFTSACYYKEIILRETKTRKVVDNSIGNKVAKVFGKKDGLITDEIVIIANGKVRAGFNLKDLSDDSVITNGDTLTITLPKAEIIDVIVNPTNFDVYIESGEWSENQIIGIKNQALEQIKSDALKEGILEKATESGLKNLKEMFKSFGYNEIIINTIQ